MFMGFSNEAGLESGGEDAGNSEPAMLTREGAKQ